MFFDPKSTVSVRFDTEEPSEIGEVKGQGAPDNALGLSGDAFTPPALLTSEEQVSGWYDAVISALPMEVRVQIARSAARRQDMAALQALSRQGSFSFGAAAQHAQQTQQTEQERIPSISECHFADFEIPIVAALGCVIEGATFARVTLPKKPSDVNAKPADNKFDRALVAGRVPRELKASDEFRVFFASEVRRFLASFDAWQKKGESPAPNAALVVDGRGAPVGRFRVTLQVLLAAAMAMDDAPTTRAILEHPFYFDMSVLRPTILGQPADRRFYGTGGRSFEMKLKAWVLGHEFDAVHALKVLENILPGHSTQAGQLTTTKALGGDPPTMGGSSVAGIIAGCHMAVPESVFHQLCLNARLGWLKGVQTKKVEEILPHTAAINFLSKAMLAGAGSTLMYRYWTAGTGAGLHTLSAEKSREVVLTLFKERLTHEITQISQDIDWSIPVKSKSEALSDPSPHKHLFDLAVDAACNFEVDQSRVFVQPLMTLFTALRQMSGRAEAYVTEHVQALGDNLVMERLARSGYREMVHQLLECGFDLDKKGASGQTMIETMAPSRYVKDPTMSDTLLGEYRATHAMLLSHKVSQEARRAIASMDEPPSGQTKVRMPTATRSKATR